MHPHHLRNFFPDVHFLPARAELARGFFLGRAWVVAATDDKKRLKTEARQPRVNRQLSIEHNPELRKVALFTAFALRSIGHRRRALAGSRNWGYVWRRRGRAYTAITPSSRGRRSRPAGVNVGRASNTDTPRAGSNPSPSRVHRNHCCCSHPRADRRPNSRCRSNHR